MNIFFLYSSYNDFNVCRLLLMQLYFRKETCDDALSEFIIVIYQLIERQRGQITFCHDVLILHCIYICHVNIVYSGLKLMVPSELLHAQIFVQYKRAITKQYNNRIYSRIIAYKTCLCRWRYASAKQGIERCLSKITLHYNNLHVESLRGYDKTRNTSGLTKVYNHSSTLAQLYATVRYCINKNALKIKLLYVKRRKS